MALTVILVLSLACVLLTVLVAVLGSSIVFLWHRVFVLQAKVEELDDNERFRELPELHLTTPRTTAEQLGRQGNL